MDVFKPNPQITAETILSYISQEEIMERYLGYSPNSVEGYFTSTLRNDTHPTCTFTEINGKVLFRDWAREEAMDCFSVVKEVHGCDFPTALEIIARDFNLVRNIREGKVEKKYEVPSITGRREKSRIEVKIQNFTQDNIEYLKSYGLTRDICNKYNVYSPSH